MDLPSPLSDESDEPQTPPRSPSRLDFCMEDPQGGGPLFETEGEPEMGDNLPPFNEQYSLEIDTPPPERPRLQIVEGGSGGSPQPTDSHSNQSAHVSHTAPAPREQTRESTIQPRSPIPIRPLLVHFNLDIREATPSPRPPPERLNYPHHGLSRSALLQQKLLWNSRHEEWTRVEQGDAQKLESDAYTGLDTAQPHVVECPPPCTRTSPSGLERDLASHPPSRHEQDATPSIFPRVGDISALRDPHSVDMDRCFFKFPLWTLHKMLFMFDMHHRSASTAPSTPAWDSPRIQASSSTSTLSSYTSSGSADGGSDSTFVADGSPVPASQSPPESLGDASSPQSSSSWNSFCGWHLSWYARWELLFGLFQRDQTRCDVVDMSVKVATPVGPGSPPSSLPDPIHRFVIGGQVGDKDDDDDEDYGMVVPDPIFSVDFDEEYERAMAFCNRETAFSEMD